MAGTYHSTRGMGELVDAKAAILEGLAADGSS